MKKARSKKSRDTVPFKENSDAQKFATGAVQGVI